MSESDKTVDRPANLKSRTDQADFRNAFMNAIRNHLLSSLVKTPLARDREIAFINAMTARRGFISPRGVEQAGELAGRPLGK
jgi:hypothetical protein